MIYPWWLLGTKGADSSAEVILVTRFCGEGGKISKVMYTFVEVDQQKCARVFKR